MKKLSTLLLALLLTMGLMVTALATGGGQPEHCNCCEEAADQCQAEVHCDCGETTEPVIVPFYITGDPDDEPD